MPGKTQRLFCYIAFQFLLRICDIKSIVWEGAPGLYTECTSKKFTETNYAYHIYSGTKDTTAAGVKCVDWEKGAYKGGKFMPAYKNYCRIFTNTFTYYPWCYTDGGFWNYCGIPYCDNSKLLAEGIKRNKEYQRYANSFKICLGPKIYRYHVYGGNLVVTKSGKQCDYWATSSKTNKDIFMTNSKSYLRSQKNYCRTMNPEHTTSIPWCYTKTKLKWEYCRIPKCEIYTTCVGPVFMDGQHQYFGAKSTTKKGKQCVYWNKVTFKKHISYGDLNNNYCRVIVGMKQKLPWCYTSVSLDKWEYCDIPLCTKNEIEIEEAKKSSTASTTSTKPNYIWEDEIPDKLKEKQKSASSGLGIWSILGIIAAVVLAITMMTFGSYKFYMTKKYGEAGAECSTPKEESSVYDLN